MFRLVVCQINSRQLQTYTFSKFTKRITTTLALLLNQVGVFSYFPYRWLTCYLNSFHVHEANFTQLYHEMHASDSEEKG